MKRPILICLLLLTIVAQGSAQIQAKAISYTLEVDLKAFASNYESDDPNPVIRYEVDTYYTESKLKTIVRLVAKPKDYDLTIRQRLYDINSKDEYNIDHEQRYVLLKKNQEVKLKATGKQKDILGYRCKEYSFTDYRGVQMSVWVTDKLAKNICPIGNFSLKGTALEVTTSNGLRYVATDFASGELATGFFDTPVGYQEEVKELAAADKKTK